MTKISQGNKKITTRKLPATDNKVLVCTGSLCFLKSLKKFEKVNNNIFFQKKMF